MTTATATKPRITRLETLCDLAEQAGVTLDRLEYPADKELTLSGIGSRAAFKRYLAQARRFFTVTDHRTTFDCFAKRPRLYVTVKLGAGPSTTSGSACNEDV